MQESSITVIQQIAQFFVMVLTSAVLGGPGPGCLLSFDCLRARAPGFLVSQAATVPAEAAHSQSPPPRQSGLVLQCLSPMKSQSIACKRLKSPSHMQWRSFRPAVVIE
ncbi:uncharacterized [Tachysurus ichikawai]